MSTKIEENFTSRPSFSAFVVFFLEANDLSCVSGSIDVKTSFTMFVIKDWRRQESEMSCLTPSGHICCVVHVAKVAGFLLHSPCRSHVINKGFNRQTSGSGGLLANLELMATLCNRRTAENHQRSQTGRYVLANCFFCCCFFLPYT